MVIVNIIISLKTYKLLSTAVIYGEARNGAMNESEFADHGRGVRVVSQFREVQFIRYCKLNKRVILISTVIIDVGD